MGLEIRSGYQGTQFGESLVTVRGRIRSTMSWDRPSGIGVLTLASPSSL